ncbi:MAG: hypothetical protein K2H47_00570 [Muribaculaceae bacterium]|nr:hypothetical protein [Muribaculaceae bacterium]
MKKFFSLALCLAAVCSMSAQKQNVDQAAKLSGKSDKLAEARELIKAAMEDPETKNDARTYFVAGKIELDAFDNGYKAQMINPDNANTDEMGQQLLNAYGYFLQALPLDSVPDAKGSIKPKFSKDIVSKLAGHHQDFGNAGVNFFNSKKFYPQAYEAFMIYSDMPSLPFMGKSAPAVAPEDIATFYFNAGLSAYSGNAVDKAAAAFKKAREAGYPAEEPYIYEIASWQNIAQTDEARTEEAKKNIFAAAKAGYDKFGLQNPLFMNNMINSMVSDGNTAAAIDLLTQEITAHPDNAVLYGLRGYVNDRAGNDDASEADYLKAASMPDVDFETLKNASKKIARIGTMKWANIEGATEAQRNEIKTHYFDKAMEIADKAANINPNDDDLNYVIENIQYALDTYF